jgi:hypothetical protein
MTSPLIRVLAGMACAVSVGAHVFAAGADCDRGCLTNTRRVESIIARLDDVHMAPYNPCRRRRLLRRPS